MSKKIASFTAALVIYCIGWNYVNESKSLNIQHSSTKGQ